MTTENQVEVHLQAQIFKFETGGSAMEASLSDRN